MGEVYRATDTKLGRDVAVKLIAANVAQDAGRMASFTREAQVLASLNHPNIATIYGVEQDAIVMELVEGPTLAERIKQGPIPFDEAIGIARQMAEALATAHDKGIVHRDLKPANIKITPEGTVKLLDFGLAKAAAVAAVPPDEAMTIATSMSGSVISGTPGYMAPEQARGQDVDKRADIWAFGVVLYEMLTGTMLFRGDTTTDVLAAVVREDPDLNRVPDRVRPLLRRCLEKDPRRRLRDIADAMLFLETASEAPAAAVPAQGASRMPWLGWAAVGLLITALGVLAAVHFRETAPVVNTVRFKFALPEGVTFPTNAPFAISPDGRTLAFPAVGADGVPRVWLHPLDAAESQPLTGAEVGRAFGAFVWSPDSRHILYTHDQKLKRVDVEGGPAQTIVDLGGVSLSAAWHPEGIIVFGAVGGLMQVPASGGTPVPLTKADASRQEAHAIYGFLPDSREFLYTRGGPAGSRSIYIGSLDDAPDEQSETPLLKTDLGVAFLPGREMTSNGHLMYMRDATLVAQRFDAGARQLMDDPEPIAEQVFAVVGPTLGSGFFSTSDQGTLVYRTGTIAGLARQLTWFSRDGKALGTIVEPGRYLQLKLSPDATRLVASRTEVETGNNADIWITDLAAQTSTRLTFSREADVQPTWSPDGRQIAWAALRDGVPGLYRKPADGSGSDELLYTFSGGGPGNIIVSDWSVDGRFLVYALGGDVFALPIGEGTDATRHPIPIAQTPAREFGPDLSPDSRWIVYISDETGRQELYVQPFAPAGQAAGPATPVGGRWMVSSSGTLGLARWRRDGRELMFVGADGSLMAVDVTSTPVFKASAPRRLFELPRPFLVQTGNPGTLADITSDGERLLLALPSEQSTRPELSVVVNWQPG